MGDRSCIIRKPICLCHSLPKAELLKLLLLFLDDHRILIVFIALLIGVLLKYLRL